MRKTILIPSRQNETSKRECGFGQVFGVRRQSEAAMALWLRILKDPKRVRLRLQSHAKIADPSGKSRNTALFGIDFLSPPHAHSLLTPLLKNA